MKNQFKTIFPYCMFALNIMTFLKKKIPIGQVKPKRGKLIVFKNIFTWVSCWYLSWISWYFGFDFDMAKLMSSLISN